MLVPRFKRFSPLALAAPMLLAAGCAGDAPAREVATRATQAVISDALHGAGTSGFLFLPPMVPRPATFGDFVPTANPTVRIDQLNPDGTTYRTLATFTATTGPGRERIRVHLQGHPCDPDDDDGDTDPMGYFVARWKTHSASLSLSATYRVRVMVPRAGGGDREVGFADVDVVRNELESRAVNTASFVPLINGRVLRIKFRLDRAAVDSDADGVNDAVDNCPSRANVGQLDTDHDGQGDACECDGVLCAPAQDGCHRTGVCNPTNGRCPAPAAVPNGTACSLANATAACTDGVCRVSACRTSFANCDGNAANGCEVATTTVSNCRACGTVCAAGAHAAAACTASGCSFACEAGFDNCDGNAANGCERNVATDQANCGACGRACATGQTCIAGACSTITCTGNRANCDGNAANGCEARPISDVANCGACGRVCSFPHAGTYCASGRCTIGACTAGYNNCDGDLANGCEAPINTDAANCGMCGFDCQLPHVRTQSCAAGLCVVAAGSCEPGWADCDAVRVNGCETAIDTTSNCGACGRACAGDTPHGTTVCAASACAIGACAAGFADCDHDVDNGCENDLDDVANCGACGRTCAAGPHATPVCGASGCGLRCDGDWYDANGDAADGCELSITTNTDCGAPGHACTSSTGATSTCVSQVCSTIACATDLANCNSDAADGCEVTTATDVNHCGACGHVCSFPHAVPECGGGTCGFSECEPNWADCDGNRQNGCEVDLLRDTANCGTCGVTAATLIEAQLAREDDPTLPDPLSALPSYLYNFHFTSLTCFYDGYRYAEAAQRQARAEAAAAAEAERIRAEQEAAALAAEAEQIRQAQIAADNERARLAAEALAAQQAAEQEAAEQQRLEAEREAARLETERLAAEQAEARRLAQEAEAEAARQAEAQRLAELAAQQAAAQAEAERLAAEAAAAEQARQQAEADARALAEAQAAADQARLEELARQAALAAAQAAEAARIAEEQRIQAEQAQLEAARAAAEAAAEQARAEAEAAAAEVARIAAEAERVRQEQAALAAAAEEARLRAEQERLEQIAQAEAEAAAEAQRLAEEQAAAEAEAQAAAEAAAQAQAEAEAAAQAAAEEEARAQAEAEAAAAAEEEARLAREAEEDAGSP